MSDNNNNNNNIPQQLPKQNDIIDVTLVQQKQQEETVIQAPIQIILPTSSLEISRTTNQNEIKEEKSIKIVNMDVSSPDNNQLSIEQQKITNLPITQPQQIKQQQQPPVPVQVHQIIPHSINLVETQQQQQQQQVQPINLVPMIQNQKQEQRQESTAVLVQNILVTNQPRQQQQQQQQQQVPTILQPPINSIGTLNTAILSTTIKQQQQQSIPSLPNAVPPVVDSTIQLDSNNTRIAKSYLKVDTTLLPIMSISTKSTDVSPMLGITSTANVVDATIKSYNNSNNDHSKINWDMLRQRLLVNTNINNNNNIDLNDSIRAINEIKNYIHDIGFNNNNNNSTINNDYQLFLNMFVPIFSTILASSYINTITASNTMMNTTTTEQKYLYQQQQYQHKLLLQLHELRYIILEIIRSIPKNDILRLHASTLIAVAMDVLLNNTNLHNNNTTPHTPIAAVPTSTSTIIDITKNLRYSEDNAIQAAHIIFDLYKQYRNLPSDSIQIFLDYVIALYRALPNSVQINFTNQSLLLNINNINNNNYSTSSNSTLLLSTSLSPTKGNSIDQIQTPFAASAVQSTGVGIGSPGNLLHDGKYKASPTMSPTSESIKQPTINVPQLQLLNDNSPTKTTQYIPPTSMNIQTPSPNNQQQQQPHYQVSSPQTPYSNSSLSSSILRTNSSSAVTQTNNNNNNTSFRVLTECPLIVMLIFQLYPRYMKANIPVLIRVMTEALALRVPPIQTVLPNLTPPTPIVVSSSTLNKKGEKKNPVEESSTTTGNAKSNPNNIATNSNTKLDSAMKRLYFSRTRELISSQAKTLSFLTYLLRSFANELKPYEDRLATNVVTLMSACPRESISTRKELLVATRHLLNNNDFRKGFFKHIDTLLDARVLMGSSSHYHYYHHYYYNSASYRFSDQAMLRPLGYTTLSDLIQHVRQILTIGQISRVVSIFSRILHDNCISVTPLPLSTQYSAVRTLISLVDLIYQNKDTNPQVGRDLLCRMMDTLVDKLQALNEYFPKVLAQELKREREESIPRSSLHTSSHTPTKDELLPYPFSSPQDRVRDVHSTIRAIIVGIKTIIYYLNNYRTQREKINAAASATSSTVPGPVTSNIKGYTANTTEPTVAPTPPLYMPPPGSNEEVSSAMLKLTHTELAMIDRYIVAALPAIKLLKISGTSSTLPDATIGHTDVAVVNTNTMDKALLEHHRDALTQFAASFSSLDGYNLRRTLGTRIESLVDAVIEDPIVMMIPRQLLASNRTTSYEFCSILIDFLVGRMHLLGYPRANDEIIFLEENQAFLTKNDSITIASSKNILQKQLQRAFEKPLDSDDQQKQRSITILHLFERVLKSLTTYPDNETVLRRSLRRIVVICFRSAMENIDNWSDNYCMLLRYIFRSISAGKFEESYKELLPLIPTVLNGLYRVIISTSHDSKNVIRYTSIELCLTIPARLSSLLPHMNLLLRIIIPALDSNSGDLVNLGLRTLEFWVDNLNPLFLHPEMSKEIDLSTLLMQALSRHLRPAPYPYGLLTLRLLGKLGGRNRQFLRCPMALEYHQREEPQIAKDPYIECKWNRAEESASKMLLNSSILIPIPLSHCLKMLKMIATVQTSSKTKCDSSFFDTNTCLVSHTESSSVLWSSRIEDIDLEKYRKDFVSSTLRNQATACFAITRTFIREKLLEASPFLKKQNSGMINNDFVLLKSSNVKHACIILCYACVINDIKDDALALLKDFVKIIDKKIFAESIVIFVSDPSEVTTEIGIKLLSIFLNPAESHRVAETMDALESTANALIASLCETCRSSEWCRYGGLHEAILFVMNTVGCEWSRKHEVMLVNVAMMCIKTVPRELSLVATKSLRFYMLVCTCLYGTPLLDECNDDLIIDMFSSDKRVGNKTQSYRQSKTSEMTDLGTKVNKRIILPCEDVFRIIVFELASPQHLVRFAARFLIVNFMKSCNQGSVECFSKNLSLIRRVLFSRALRLLHLPQQVGVVEGLAVFIKQQPGIMPLSDQHLLAFLSELLKMLSVADGEMSDNALKNHAVNKDGYTTTETERDPSTFPTHSSSLFFRRECIVEVQGIRFLIPEELPAGVQLRVSTIVLLHSVILGHSERFFDAEWIGNIRPHVISLLFRSLVSNPLRAVDAAHHALRDVLSVCVVTKSSEDGEVPKTQSRLPKELVQTCIRPVLLHLRDYARLSPALLRGLSRLLSLLSSWFNKTLGEKLLDHLEKWTDPTRIITQKKWREGEEPFVAAAIVGIFSSLPHASHFVEPLVKTCIKLENSLSAYRSRLIDSPFRRPLARYLAKHPNFTVSFFFQRLKTPMYSEMFQYILELEESEFLRTYLSSKQCSLMILNVCFERPLAIIRSEKSSSSGTQSKNPLFVHGIGQSPVNASDSVSISPRPMNTEALELQLQGFRLVNTLLVNNTSYFKDHNDIVRAFRWLWRSKGRFFRLQHEDLIPPRYHEESKMLAKFLMSYAKSHSNEDLDILFELIRIFMQPSTGDFSFVSNFLTEIVTHILSIDQQKKVLQRFFALVAGENEESKVLSIQFLIFPMVSFVSRYAAENRTALDDTVSSQITSDSGVATRDLVDHTVIARFVKDVLLPNGVAISCGDRLTVELLRLLNIFVEWHAHLIEPFRNELMLFYLNLLKSEDTSCKSWAYIVACRFIANFDAPSSTVFQVYFALLRLYQPEGKELIRVALDIIVPSLPKRLNDTEIHKLVDQTSQMMLEDTNSTLQLAHISQTIVRCQSVFYYNRSRLIPLLINSLSRLGLGTNYVHDNIILSLDVGDLILEWQQQVETTIDNQITFEQSDCIINFLVRLKLSLIEHHDSKNISVGLEIRVEKLLHRALSTRMKPNIRIAPLENAIHKSKKVPGAIIVCLQIFSLMCEFKHGDFFLRSKDFFNVVVKMGFEHARENVHIQKELRNVIYASSFLDSLHPVYISFLEKIIEDAHLSQEMKDTAGIESERHGVSNTREKAAAPDVANVFISYAKYALEILSELCKQKASIFRKVHTTLLSLTKTLTMIHLSGAAARQRQGSSNSSRTSPSGMRHHTPSVGILEATFFGDEQDNSRVLPGKSRSVKDDTQQLSDSLRCLIILISIFESSDIMYHFSQSRKKLLQILIGVIDASDNLQLLLISVRFVGTILLSHGAGSPVTLKERNSLLSKLASFDFTSLPDDIVAQPLADLVATFTKRFLLQNMDNREVETDKLVVSCLLSANELIRGELLNFYFQNGSSLRDQFQIFDIVEVFWRLLHTDFEGLGGRFWVSVFVEAFIRCIVYNDRNFIEGICTLAQADMSFSHCVFELLLPAAWDMMQDDRLRVQLVAATELLLSRPFHNQFSLTRSIFFLGDGRSLNAMRSFINAMVLMRPIPVLDISLLVLIAENYNCWHEILSLIEKQYAAFQKTPNGETMLSAMRHCYRRLGEEDMWLSLARESSRVAKSSLAISFDIYSLVDDAVSTYSELVELVESADTLVDPTDFEMDLWEERWVLLHKELSQFQLVSEFANESGNPHLQLECAWKSQDWNKVRTLCTSSSLLAAVENGDPIVKLSETLLAVADGKLTEVENLHAQTAQLCLYKWQLLPRISSGSMSHASLLHFFHRLVEIRESGQIMAETGAHASAKTLPDLKNLLNAWRHRLPNDWERISTWDEVFSWRAHMFSAITSNFHWAEPNTLASLHDRPWSTIRIAKTARKQGMRDVSLFLLNRAAEERTMNVSDAFLKLREQILAYFNPSSDLERHGGLNLINTTNLSFFDAPQKSELFRLKASFLYSLGGRSKANQAYCHSVQICPTHARAWDSWGELCGSLGAVAEKHLEQGAASVAGGEAKDDKTNTAKKVAQYLAQAMGCYIEAIQIDTNEWARMHIAKCLWMLSKDGSTPGVLCQTFENRGSKLPPWVWLPWLPTLLTSLYRREGKAVKTIFSNLIKTYPQAVYYPLRAFYLERRDVDRGQGSSTSPTQNNGSFLYAEELMSMLRKSHASLWSSLESILEELTVKFRPSYEEELLSTVIALLERVQIQVGAIGKKDVTEAFVHSAWMTLKRMAVKFFRHTDTASVQLDSRSIKTAAFKEAYKASFEIDFNVTAIDDQQVRSDDKLDLESILSKLRKWRSRLEDDVLKTPKSMSLIEASHSLAMFGVSDTPDLWPGSCDPTPYTSRFSESELLFEADPVTTVSTTSSSVFAARKAANTAASSAVDAAVGEGVGGDYGGGSSWIEIPGQYMPNSSSWTDTRPTPELHAKLLRFESKVEVLRRNDQLVRRIGMIASDGNVYRFHLQFAVPSLTRTDERTSQTSYFLDKIFRKDIRASRAHLSIQSHPVVPVAPRLRLISEPDSRTSLEDIHNLNCDRSNINSSKLSSLFNDEIKSMLNDKLTSSMSETERLGIENIVRKEVYLKIQSQDGNGTMLSNYVFSVLNGPEQLYHFRRVFAQQWAINCLLQYVFSTLERTPGRVVFVENTGQVLSPEFRTSYGTQGYMDKTILPFRLTASISFLIGSFLLEARFIPSFAIAANAVHDCKDDVEPIWRLLMRDDLVAFYTKATAKSDSKTVEMEKQLVERVSRNVSVLSARFSECSPIPKAADLGEKQKSAVDQKVRDLINAARSPDNLCLMPGNYMGWL